MYELEELKAHRDLLSARLRSGEETQTTGVLRRPDGSMCCLGVACQVFHEETGRGQWLDDQRTINGKAVDCCSFVVDGCQGQVDLPEPVTRWYGFSRDSPALNQGDAQGTPPHLTPETKSAVVMNDSDRYSFTEIAVALDATPPVSRNAVRQPYGGTK